MGFFDFFIIRESDNIIDVFKDVDFSDIIDTDDYTIYKRNDFDNLMSISYRFYNNVEDWWLIYFFNKFIDSSFAIIPEKVLQDTLTKYLDVLSDWDNKTRKEQQILQEFVRNYFSTFEDLETAIASTNNQLSTQVLRDDVIFVSAFKNYLLDDIISTEKITEEIRVPNQNVVFAMKSKMNDYNISWLENQ